MDTYYRTGKFHFALKYVWVLSTKGIYIKGIFNLPLWHASLCHFLGWMWIFSRPMGAQSIMLHRTLCSKGPHTWFNAQLIPFLNSEYVWTRALSLFAVLHIISPILPLTAHEGPVGTLGFRKTEEFIGKGNWGKIL